MLGRGAGKQQQRKRPLDLSEAVRVVLVNAQRFRGDLSASAAAASAAAGSGAGPQHCGAPTDAESLLDGRRWRPDELEVMVRKAVGISRGASAEGYLDELLTELGWDRIPDTEKRIRTRVKSKFSHVRALLDHGVKPEEVVVRKAESRNKACTYKAWTLKAFEALPDHQGTLSDVCTFLLADPKVAPLLDNRPDAHKRAVPRWRQRISRCMTVIAGVSSTGEKRDGLTVYRYSPQDAAATAAAKRAPKRGRAGPPQLGKNS